MCWPDLWHTSETRYPNISREISSWAVKKSSPDTHPRAVLLPSHFCTLKKEKYWHHIVSAENPLVAQPIWSWPQSNRPSVRFTLEVVGGLLCFSVIIEKSFCLLSFNRPLTGAAAVLVLEHLSEGIWCGSCYNFTVYDVKMKDERVMHEQASGQSFLLSYTSCQSF